MSQYGEEDAFQGEKMKVFTGLSAEAESFKEQWKTFVVTNNVTQRFTVFKAVVLFLTYIKGPIVNTWVKEQFTWLRLQLQAGVSENDLHLAQHVENEFEQAFSSSLEQEGARATLRKGEAMKGYDIQGYAAWFEPLVRKAGYRLDTPQVVDLFTNGIESTLFELCVDMEHPRTYVEWINALEKRVAIRRQLEACRPELSRSSPPSNTPSLSSLDGERSEDNDEESLAEERTLEWLEEPEIEDPEEGQSWPAEALEYADSPDEAKEEEYVESPQEEDYQESFDFEMEEELEQAQENAERNAKTPDEAEEYVDLPLSHKIKRERRQKKKVRINEWTEEYAPPDEAREQYVPEDLTPARTPSRWEQQVQQAHQELTMAQKQGPSTWAQYQFHPEAMDQSARVRVRQGESRLRMAHIEEWVERPQVCYHCRLPGHIRPLCPNRGQPRARKSRGQAKMPGEALEYSAAKMPGEATIRRVQGQRARPAKKQPTVPPPVVRARVEPSPPVQARRGYQAWNDEVTRKERQEEEDTVKRRWQTFEEEDPELYAEVQRRGLCPTDVSGPPTPRGMNAGTSLRALGVQRGRCPKKEGNVTYTPPRDQQTARRAGKLRAEEWTKSEDGITETMTGPNGVYTRFVSTSPPESEQDDA